MDPYLKEFIVEQIDTQVTSNLDKYSCLTVSDKNSVKIFHLNIRSMAKNLDQLLVLLKTFSFQFDIIVLTETFVLNDLQLYEIPDYDIIYTAGKLNKNDGVVVYIKTSIKNTYTFIDLGGNKAMRIDFTICNKKFTLTAVYRIHQTSPCDFNLDLMNYLSTINDSTDFSILLGDLNINILQQKDFINEYLNIMSECGYVSYINKYTRVVDEKKVLH